MKFKVPPGHFFFMGDNRGNSSDSREWIFVKREYLKGQAKNVTFSITFDGIIPTVNVARFVRVDLTLTKEKESKIFYWFPRFKIKRII